MKQTLLTIFTIFSGLLTGQTLNIGVITDTHYLSEKLMDGDYAVDNYVSVSGRNIKDEPAVLDKVLDEYLHSNVEVLLVCGDMTKDGEKQSHIDFVKKLKPLRDKGVRIFAIPGNHDINRPDAVELRGNKTFPVPNVSPEEFSDIYASCGYKGALKYDASSLSYVGALNGKTWLLAMDAAKYAGGTSSSGRILPETEKWIVEVLDEAREKGIQVIGMMHWGLTEHIMYQSAVFGDYLVGDWERLRTLFANKGMKAVFTGHFHANDITAFTSGEGNTIYDIETGTLAAYPFAYRFVELNTDGMNITTKNVTAIPSNPNLAADSKELIRQLAYKQAVSKLKKVNLPLPADVSARFAEVLAQIFVLHAYGDEQMDDNLKQLMQNLALALGNPVESMDEMQLDFPPADNNINLPI
jgi:predicted phosphodiesterase